MYKTNCIFSEEVIEQQIRIWGIQNYSFFPTLSVITNNLRYFSSKSEQFQILTPCTNLKWPLTYIWLKSYLTQNLSIRFAWNYTFLESLWQDWTIWHLFQRNRSMFQFWPMHVELSRSMAATLETPQYVAYQKNVAFALLSLSTKFQTFNKCRTIMPLSCA